MELIHLLIEHINNYYFKILIHYIYLKIPHIKDYADIILIIN